MFLGHWAVGLAAKRAAPTVSLGTLFLAAQWVDLVWPTFLLLGLERVTIAPGATRVTPLDFEHYPWTHSLLAAIGWGALVGSLHFVARRSARAAAAIGALVVSHWLLDLVVHRPDLPLVPGGAVVGLGLWSSLPATVAIELALLGAGSWLYAGATRPRTPGGTIGLVLLLALLFVVFVANVFGPPPPNEAAIAWAGHLQWLFVAWGYWLDHRRRPRTLSP